MTPALPADSQGLAGATEHAGSRHAARPTASVEDSPSRIEPAPSQGLPVDPADAQSIWQRILSEIQNKPAFGWVKSLRLDRLEQGSAYLSLMPGQREMARFFGDRQRSQLAQMIGKLAGRPVKVDITLPPAGSMGDDASGDGPSNAGSGRAAITAAQRQTAMSLPLVRELMEAFDLSLVEVRHQQLASPGQDHDDSEPDDHDNSSSAIGQADDLPPVDAMDDQEYFDDV